MLTTEQKGEIAYHRCAARAIEKGYILSQAQAGARYDAVLDDGKKLLKVQIKYADGHPKEASGSVEINLRRGGGSKNAAKVRTYTSSEIDLLLAFLPKVEGKILAFKPRTFAGKYSLSVRLVPSKSGQVRGTNLAKNFVW